MERRGGEERITIVQGEARFQEEANFLLVSVKSFSTLGPQGK